MKWWTTVLAPTDISDPRTGEPLYVAAKVRPAWYWNWRRVCLFLSIVWRKYEVSRIDWRTAWAVSKVAKGLTPGTTRNERNQDK